MNTQKVAITIPMDVLAKIDVISKKLGLSRSKYISILLHEKLSEVIENQLKDSYDRVFSDERGHFKRGDSYRVEAGNSAFQISSRRSKTPWTTSKG